MSASTNACSWLDLKPFRDPEELGVSLDWKDFEKLAEDAFRAFGFETKRNVRFKKPRMEIDLLATKGSVAFAVDCKHWKRTVGNAAMSKVAEKQVKRAIRIFEISSCSRVIPIILTLHDEMLNLLDSGVVIVPIHKLSDLVLNWEVMKESMHILEPPEEGRQTNF